MEVKARDKLLLLTILNVFQGMVTLEELENTLTNQAKVENLKGVLNSLVHDGLARKVSQDQYVLSQKGLKIFRPLLRKRRDVQRMLYLSNKCKKG